jgi:hypothetical protein
MVTGKDATEGTRKRAVVLSAEQHAVLKHRHLMSGSTPLSNQNNDRPEFHLASAALPVGCGTVPPIHILFFFEAGAYPTLPDADRPSKCKGRLYGREHQRRYIPLGLVAKVGERETRAFLERGTGYEVFLRIQKLNCNGQESPNPTFVQPEQCVHE